MNLRQANDGQCGIIVKLDIITKRTKQKCPNHWDNMGRISFSEYINYSFSYGFLSFAVIVFNVQPLLLFFLWGEFASSTIQVDSLCGCMNKIVSISWYVQNPCTNRTKKLFIHVINFYINAGKRCEIQQWATTAT